MGISDLLPACPGCGAEGGVRPAGDGARCRACGMAYTRGEEARIVGVAADGAREEAGAGAWLDRLAPADPAWPVEAPVRVRFGLPPAPIRLKGQLLGWRERLGDAVGGHLRLSEDDLAIRADHGRAYAWPLAHVTGLQLGARALQVKIRGLEVLALSFPEDSPRRWERLFQAALAGHWRACGRGAVREFQPRVVAGP